MSSAGGNYLTSRTVYLEGGASPAEREATFDHDVRGNVLRETNPAAPDFVLNKYDNLGRLVATAEYKDSVSATDDPTTETTNRLSLFDVYYDELGRVWKTRRHKIDQDDGSSDATLASMTWYDKAGRVMKQRGETLRKVFYDRLGRQTHEFILAWDDDSDSTYGHADDVDGDHVLQERQTVYSS